MALRNRLGTNLPDGVDPAGLVASLLAVAIVAYGLSSPGATDGLHWPVTYVLLGLGALVVVTLPYTPVRETRLWGVLAGATMAALGAHNLAGPGEPLVTGYGFLLAGTLGAAYNCYVQFAPATWPRPSFEGRQE